MSSEKKYTKEMDSETLLAIISAAAMTALGEDVRILSISSNAEDPSKFQSWIYFARSQAFLLANTRR